ncbi:MAG: glycosyltransferase [Gemmatimonadales bacterium]
MTGTIRVLHVVPDLEFGGLQRLVVDMARLTSGDGFDCAILALGALGPLADQVKTDRLLVGGPQPAWSMIWPGRLAAKVASFSPTVVHTHSGVWYKASLAARQAGVRRIIHTDHGRRRPDPWIDRLVDGLASRRTDVVVAVSETLGQYLARAVVHDRAAVRVIMNGVDTSLFRPGADRPLRSELGIAPEALILGSIGRLEPIKGYDVMIEGFAKLREGPLGGRTILVLAGDGSERLRLEQRVAQLGLSQAVRFLGWRSDLGRLYSTFDVFALTSRSEGTSVSLLEAMSSALCPVVTDVGGNRAVLGAELAQQLVPANDPEAIAAGWTAALLNAERRHAIGRLARRRVETDFSLGAMVGAYQQVYRSLVSRHPS